MNTDSCCADPATDPVPATTRGLATGVSGGLLSAPLTLVAVGPGAGEAKADSCCG